MVSKLAVWFTCFLLDNTFITLSQRNILITRILSLLNALPLKETISQGDNGELVIHGKVVDVDKVIQLNTLANTALDNQVEVLIEEQIAYEAFTGAVHRCITPEDMYFYRA